MEKRKVLGRGLDSLLGARRTGMTAAQPVAAAIDDASLETFADESVADGTTGTVIEIQAVAETRHSPNHIVQIAIDDIDGNPYQTRTYFDEAALNDLAESIKTQGVLQPIVVRPSKPDGRYFLVLGERRLRASKLAGKATVPAIVKRVNEQQAAELTVIENLQRQDLNCIEQGEAFRVLSVDFRLTQQQIAERVGLSRESVANYMRILKLPESVRKHLANGTIRFSEARELLRLENDDEVTKLADELVNRSMQINQLRDRITEIQERRFGGGQKPAAAAASPIDPNVRAEQMELERMLGLRVKIRDRKGKGSIEIQYGSVEDYERVVELLRGKT